MGNRANKSLFTFCYRGAGNFSYRFYETLMMGRIPILVNTDCVFPFEDKVDINSLGLVLNEKTLKIEEFIDKIKGLVAVRIFLKPEFACCRLKNPLVWAWGVEQKKVVAIKNAISPIIHINGNLRKIIRDCLLIGFGQNASTRTKNPDIR